MTWLREIFAARLGSVESTVPSGSGVRWCAAVAAREPVAAARMRAFTTFALRAWGLTELIEDLELCVSELVTNAVRHSAGSLVALSLAFTTELIVEVFDRGPGVPVIKPVEAEFEGGRGLWLVEAVSGEWGWEALHGGWKRVWCSFPVPDLGQDAEGPDRCADRSGPELTAAKVSCPP
jgi:anti-sigma regulatory factor (Ser/Thr protein kinase)